MNTKATLDVGSLDLDPINPRTNPEADQTAAMRSLISVEREGEKIHALAQNICEMGALDPGDRLYTIESEDDASRYVVLDGNRRLTALRLLSQPGMLDRDDIGLSIALRQRFKRLQKDYAGKWPSLELTPFHGHLIVQQKGVQDAQTAYPQAALFGGISSTTGRTRASWAQSQ